MLIDLNLNLLTDGVIIFKPYKYSDNICSKFNINEWHHIVTDIHNDQEWNSFINDYKEIITCLSVYKCKNNEFIGFVYLYLEDYSKRIISVHGGGWTKSTEHSLLFYRASICIIHHLLEQNIKVRTSCLRENERAYKIIKSLGFVKYKTTEYFNLMWITRTRLYNNQIYKYLYRINKINKQDIRRS